MKPVLVVLAASTLGIGLLAGLAGTDSASATQGSSPTSWVDPPSRGDEACAGTAWPYAAATCAPPAAAPMRKVRVVPVDARAGSAVPTMVRLSAGAASPIPLPRR